MYYKFPKTISQNKIPADYHYYSDSLHQKYLSYSRQFSRHIYYSKLFVPKSFASISCFYPNTILINSNLKFLPIPSVKPRNRLATSILCRYFLEQFSHSIPTGFFFRICCIQISNGINTTGFQFPGRKI